MTVNMKFVLQCSGVQTRGTQRLLLNPNNSRGGAFYQ